MNKSSTETFLPNPESCQSFRRRCYTFCSNLFRYLYSREKNLNMFPNNDFFNYLNRLLLNQCATFKSSFRSIWRDFPFQCNTDQAHVEYIVEHCTLLITGRSYQSFLVSCAFILYLLKSFDVHQCHRLIYTGPFSAFVILKRLLEFSEFGKDGDTVNEWIRQLKNYCVSNFDYIPDDDIKLISNKIFMYREAKDAERFSKVDRNEVSFGPLTHCHGTVLERTEMKMLARMSVPKVSFEEYADFPYTTCLLCRSKCFIYYRMFAEFYGMEPMR